METRPLFFIRMQGKARGPFAFEQLRELVASGSITADTEVATSTDGPWAPLQSFPMRVLLFSQGAPLKPQEFARDNLASTAPVDHHQLIAAANLPGPARPAAVMPSLSPPAPPASPAHDIRSLLRYNLKKEKSLGLHRLAQWVPRKSRRRRDYFILLGSIGALIFTVLIFEAVLAVSLQVLAAQMPDQFWPILYAVLFHSPILAWGLAAFSFYWVALTWFMFVVMDDY